MLAVKPLITKAKTGAARLCALQISHANRRQHATPCNAFRSVDCVTFRSPCELAGVIAKSGFYNAFDMQDES
jgi:hypothetical protein